MSEEKIDIVLREENESLRNLLTRLAFCVSDMRGALADNAFDWANIEWTYKENIPLNTKQKHQTNRVNANFFVDVSTTLLGEYNKITKKIKTNRNVVIIQNADMEYQKLLNKISINQQIK
jgi:hypothetical protein